MDPASRRSNEPDWHPATAVPGSHPAVSLRFPGVRLEDLFKGGFCTLARNGARAFA
jgi:hypothetical protein